MRTKFQTLLSACILFATVSLISCKKEGSLQSPAVSEEEAMMASEENTSADAEYDDITEIGLSAGADLEAGTTSGGEVPGSVNGGGVGLGVYLFADLQFKIGPCVKIDVTPNDSTFPKTVTINYGEGCLCRDGKFRKGVIELYFTGPIRKPGSVLTITLRDYYVNRVHIEGKKIVTNLSEANVNAYSTTVVNGKVSWPNGRGFTYEGAKVVTQVRGSETRTVRDDVYSIEGRNKTVFASGLTVNKNTETPLIKPVACSWIVQGILKIKINDRVLFIDFGAGDCDNKAMLKWAGGERAIVL